MNASLLTIEIAVLLLGLGLLLLDLWTVPERKRLLGYGAAAALGLVLLYSLRLDATTAQVAFGGSYVLDGLALFFKRLFLLAAILVLLLAVEFADRIAAGISEYYSLIVFALAGMLFAASAADFTLLFVAIELITITFYVLTSFQRGLRSSLEAGVKYLVMGGIASAFMVYGIALVYGTSGTMNFAELAARSGAQTGAVFHLGLLLVFLGLGFKIAAFPLQIWAPDVYQGAPTPTTGFLAVGSKGAGFVLLLRFLFTAVPEITAHWTQLLMAVAGITILYGNLCAIPQRGLKRLLGYSSIAHAGYLLLGVAAMAAAGKSPAAGGTAVLYYLAGYLFTVLAAFAVLGVVLRGVEGDDISALAGLGRRSPLLAAMMTLAMVSLAGVPPLAGFFGKFLLIKSAVEQGAVVPGLYGVVAVALVGVVISLWYYFGVIRVIYWSRETAEGPCLRVSWPTRGVLAVCLAGMLFLGLYPNPAVNAAGRATQALQTTATAVTAR